MRDGSFPSVNPVSRERAYAVASVWLFVAWLAPLLLVHAGGVFAQWGGFCLRYGPFLFCAGMLLYFTIFGQLVTALNLEKPNRYTCLTALLEGVIGVGIVFASNAGVTLLLSLFGIEIAPAAEQNLMKNGDVRVFFNIAFSALIIAPVMEEFYFRRFIFDALFHLTQRKTFQARHIPMRWAFSAVVTALIFALIHTEGIKLVPMFCFGLYLQYLRLRHASLWPAFIAHVFNNAVTLFYFLALRLF